MLKYEELELMVGKRNSSEGMKKRMRTDAIVDFEKWVRIHFLNGIIPIVQVDWKNTSKSSGLQMGASKILIGDATWFKPQCGWRHHHPQYIFHYSPFFYPRRQHC